MIRGKCKNMNLNTEMVSEIYSHIQDEKSKVIYANRLLYSLTKDRKYLENVTRESCVYDKMRDILTETEGEKVIFGAGELGQLFYDYFNNIADFTCFIDSYKTGTYKDISIISIDEYIKNKNKGTIFICSWFNNAEQYKQLMDFGVAEERIVNVARVMNKEMQQTQYFDLPEFYELKTDEEVFVDGGAYDGSTSLQFMEWCNNKYKKIYVLEPDSLNIEKCKKKLKAVSEDKIVLCNKGLAEKEEVLHFTNSHDGSAKISEDGDSCIEVVSLDNLIPENVTFIKMDIEGAEYQAILGAKRLLEEYKPKLAISMYHKPEDMWEIPSLILKINPEYKFYLRHYTMTKDGLETVLYAI